MLIAYNVSGTPRNDFVIVDATLHGDGSTMKFLYGGAGTTSVRMAANGARNVQLSLPGFGFVILA